jgi:hypothetical protein
MKMKYKFLFTVVILLSYSITLCYSNKFHIKTKCCPRDGQILNSTFNGCIDNTQIYIKFNVSDIKNSSNVNYTTHALPVVDKLNYFRLNLPCEFRNIEVLFADEFNISQSDVLTPMTIKGVKEFNSNEYCWDKIKNDDEVEGIVALTCPCLRGPCVHVCCGKGQMMEMDNSYQ